MPTSVGPVGLPLSLPVPLVVPLSLGAGLSFSNSSVQSVAGTTTEGAGRMVKMPEAPSAAAFLERSTSSCASSFATRSACNCALNRVTSSPPASSAADAAPLVAGAFALPPAPEVASASEAERCRFAVWLPFISAHATNDSPGFREKVISSPTPAPARNNTSAETLASIPNQDVTQGQSTRYILGSLVDCCLTLPSYNSSPAAGKDRSSALRLAFSNDFSVSRSAQDITGAPPPNTVTPNRMVSPSSTPSGFSAAGNRASTPYQSKMAGHLTMYFVPSLDNLSTTPSYSWLSACEAMWHGTGQQAPAREGGGHKMPTKHGG
mmetsp:Transcript_22403/g.62948  ORF Transcript_22403/g.62948 Transcript_22403/m.62948 type:complete len:321 (-) Transcript_22403:11-973(-)